MTTLSSLIASVRLAVTNPSYTDDQITAYLNEGVQNVAAGVFYQDGMPESPPLPDLLTTGTVSYTASVNYVSLPSDYGRSLIRAFNSSGTEIKVARSWNRYLLEHPNLDDTGGEISSVCIRGSRLYAQPTPTSAQTLTLHYYRLPTDMSDSSDEPDGIPAKYHRRVLTPYAAKEIYSNVEVDINGKAANTNKQEAKFAHAVQELSRFLFSQLDGEPVYVADDEDYIEW